MSACLPVVPNLAAPVLASEAAPSAFASKCLHIRSVRRTPPQACRCQVQLTSAAGSAAIHRFTFMTALLLSLGRGCEISAPTTMANDDVTSVLTTRELSCIAWTKAVGDSACTPVRIGSPTKNPETRASLLACFVLGINLLLDLANQVSDSSDILHPDLECNACHCDTFCTSP